MRLYLSLPPPLPSQSPLCRSTLLFLSRFTPMPLSSLISTHIYSVDGNGPGLHSVEFKLSFKRKEKKIQWMDPNPFGNPRWDVLSSRQTVTGVKARWVSEKLRGTVACFGFGHETKHWDVVAEREQARESRVNLNVTFRRLRSLTCKHAAQTDGNFPQRM